MMKPTELVKALTQLNTEAQQLMAQQLDNAPDPTGRGKQAAHLLLQLQNLRPAVDGAPAAEQSRLDDLWREVQRPLVFVTAITGTANIAQSHQSEAERLNAEAFALGKQAAAPGGDKTALEKQAQVLLDQIKQALAQPTGKEAEANRLLSDALLDAMFALQGGVGPSSIRLGLQLYDSGGN